MTEKKWTKVLWLCNTIQLVKSTSTRKREKRDTVDVLVRQGQITTHTISPALFQPKNTLSITCTALVVGKTIMIIESKKGFVYMLSHCAGLWGSCSKEPSSCIEFIFFLWLNYPLDHEEFHCFFPLVVYLLRKVRRPITLNKQRPCFENSMGEPK